MHPFLIRFAQALLWRGIFYIAFGFLTLLWPDITLSVFLAFLGVFVLVSGIVAIAGAIRRIREDDDWWWWLLQGTFSVALGMLTIFFPFTTLIVLAWYLAIWLFTTGLLEVVLAIRLRKKTTGENWYIFGGALSAIAAVLLVSAPIKSAVGIAWLLGCYAILFGILLISLSSRLRRYAR